MTINDLAKKLLTHFSPEERTIPDNPLYPGRNDAVKDAINAALQELFGEAGPWVRKAPQGAYVHGPTSVTITVTEGSATGIIPSNEWRDWFAGCAIVINGASVDNRILTTQTTGNFSASLTINPAGNDNTVVFTAADGLTIAADSISIEYVNPGVHGPLSISVDTEVAAVAATATVDASGCTPGDIVVVDGVTFTCILTAPAAPREFLATTAAFVTSVNNYNHTSVIASTGGILTARIAGVAGNSLTLSKTGGAVISGALFTGGSDAEALDGPRITVTLEYDGLLALRTTAAELITAINADSEASALVAAAASGAVTGLVAAVAPANLTFTSGGCSLQLPFDGATGTVSATIYHDSVTVPDNVLRVLDPAKFNQFLVVPAFGIQDNVPRDAHDYDMHLCPHSILAPMRVGDSAGIPNKYWTETWSPSDTLAPAIRIRLTPAPGQRGMFEYQSMLVPPVVEDLTSAATLPVPFAFTQSILAPIATFHLMACDFFRQMTMPQSIGDAYQMAKKLLASGDPNKTGRTRFVTKG